jgi:formylglycine-generating enzyme required for sulfatase activity
LKPLNIMFQEGLPVSEGLKVLDFGLAKIKSGELLGSFVQAKTSGLMGSPFYMAPEQWGDEEPDARADIYSLGVILYQMLGGDVPFKGTSIPSIMKKHLTQAPPPLASLGVQVPPQIEAVVRHALEKEAENRPASVEDFIRELRDVVNSISASLSRTTLGNVSSQAQTVLTTQGITSIPPDATTLRLHTNPPASRVYINNVSVGLSDEDGMLIVPDMMRGLHRLHVLHDGYMEWEQPVECSGGVCEVEAKLQSLLEKGVPPAPSVYGHQSLGDPYAGTISSGSLADVPLQSQASMEAKRLRRQAEVLEEQARQEEEVLRREREEERERQAKEQQAREEEARKKAEEEEARLKAEEEERLRVEAEERARAEEEERLKAAEAEEQARAEEEARRKAEEETLQKAAEEARLKAEEEARLRAQEEERQRAEAARLQAEEKERKRVAAEAQREAERKQAEEARLRVEEERRQAEEAARLKAEEEARERAEAEAARKRAEAEAQARQRAEEERLEGERVAAVEREAKLQKEREEQAARIAATINPNLLPPSELDSTQGQRQGIITQNLGRDSLPGTERPTIASHAPDSIQAGRAFSGQPSYDDPMHAAVGNGHKKSGLSTLMIAAIAGVALIGGGLGVWYMTRGGAGTEVNRGETPTPTATATATVTPRPGQTEPPPVVYKPELITIPGGQFQMGRDDGAPQEGPVRQSVSVGSFSMDKTEVTNGEYAEFVRATNYPPPSNWTGDQPGAGTELLPVVNVSYQDAVKFAEWRSKNDGVKYRLPTEEEWEYAARGGDQDNIYPWGKTWAQGNAGTKDSGATGPKPVGSYPQDKTRWGVVDMAGNVYEWTSSKASLYPGNNAQIDPVHKNWMVVRGGAYVTDYRQKNPTTYRDWFEPARKEAVIGFRLVRAGGSSSSAQSPLPAVNRLLNKNY